MSFKFNEWVNKTFTNVIETNIQIISNQTEINNLYNNITSETQNLIFSFLNHNFEQCPFNICVFENNKIPPSYPLSFNITDIFINNYLSQESPKENDDNSLLLELIEKIVNIIGVTKTNVNNVLNNISKQYFYHLSQNKIQLKKYLQLLQVLYGKNLNLPKPKNYFYFSGNGFINFEAIQKTTIKEGFGISIAFKPLRRNLDFTIASIKFDNGDNISIGYGSGGKIMIKNKVTLQLKEFEWINFLMLIKIKKKGICECFIVLNGKEEYQTEISSNSNNLSHDTPINSISLLSNFLGTSTSAIIITDKPSKEHLLHYMITYPLGIYKQKQIDNVLQKNNNKNWVIFPPVISTLITQNFSCSIVGNESNGFFCRSSRSKCIPLLGGIDNILPIAEIITYKLEESDESKTENFELLNQIISSILIGQTKNMKNAFESNFFESYSCIINKLPDQVYTDKIFLIFKSLSSSMFALWDKIGLCTIFFDNIFFNKDIYQKFQIETQIKIWSHISDCFESDESQIKNFNYIGKILLVIKNYDSKCTKEFCCQYHSAMFTYDNNSNIMNPELSTKVKSLFKLIDLLLLNDDTKTFSNTINLINFISCEMSPCLLGMIFDSLISYYSSGKISEETKKNALIISIKNNLLLITFFAMSVAFPDINLKIINFFTAISALKSSVPELGKFFKKNSSNIIFCKQHLYPLGKKIFSSNEVEIDELISPPFKQNSYLFTPAKHNSIANRDESVSMFITPEKNLFSTTIKENTKSNGTKTIMYNDKITPFKSKSISGKKFMLLKQNTLNAITSSEIACHSQLELQYEKEKKENSKMTPLLSLISASELKKINVYLLNALTSWMCYPDNMSITNDFVLDILTNTLLYCDIELLNSFFGFLISLTSNENSYKDINISILASNHIFYRFLIEIIFQCHIITSNKTIDNISEENIWLSHESKESLYNNANEILTKAIAISTILTLHSQSINSVLNDFFALCTAISTRSKTPSSSLISTVLSDIIINHAFYNDGGISSFVCITNCVIGYMNEDIDQNFNIDIYHNIIKAVDSLILSDFIIEKENNEKVIEEYVSNKKKIDIYSKSIDILCNIGNFPLVKSLCWMIVTGITKINGTKEIDENINFIVRFLSFIIIASSTMNKGGEQNDKNQIFFYESISYSLNVMANNSKKKINSQIDSALIKIFELIVVIAKIAENQNKKKKKKMNFFTMIKIPSKKKNNDLNNCAIVKFYNDNFINFNLNDKNIVSILVNKLKENAETNLQKNSYIHFENTKNERIVKYKNFLLSLIEENANNNFTMKYYKIKNKISITTQTSLAIIKDELSKLVKEKITKEKKKLKIYKKIKKKIFSYNNAWSNKFFFYQNASKLKYKITNHYSSSLHRCVLVPIMNISEYIPNFSNFEKKNIFIDTNDIVNSTMIRPEGVPQERKNNLTVDVDVDPFQENIIALIYKSFSHEVTKEQKKVQEIITTNNLNEFDNYNTSLFTVSIDEKNKFNCCLVKQWCHYKGVLVIDDNKILFDTDLLSEKNKNYHDENYNEDHHACYGSYFPMENNKYKSITIPINEIHFIFIRYYFLRRSSLEIITTKHKSFFFNFQKEKNLDIVSKQLFSYLPFKKEIKLETGGVTGYEVILDSITLPPSNTVEDLISSKIDQWINWKISNFEILLWLNTFANRSFIDISQYPVFPWIISQYSNDTVSFDINKFSDARDLSLPMGMLEINEKSKKRKENYISKYTTLKVESNDPTEIYIYGSHYSNPIYISHYLTRVFPFSFIMIELQGNKFDDPNRLFKSVQRSFECAATQEADVRELCPEFYYMPEMFLNNNDLNLGISSVDTTANNVALPPWSDNNPYEFVMKMRCFIESDYVSKNICKWIDLIFGYKQKGKEAEIANNLFVPSSYDNFKLESVKNKEQRQYYLGVAEFGLTPRQLFNKEFPTRKKKDIKLVMDSIRENQLKYTSNKIKNQKKELNMLILKVINNEKVIGVFDNYQYTIYKFIQSSIDSKLHIDSSTKHLFNMNNPTASLILRYRPYPYASLIYNSGKCIILSGYLDNKIFVIKLPENTGPSQIVVYSNEFEDSSIINLAIDRDDNFVFAGSKEGSVYIYKVSAFFNWTLVNHLSNHSNDPITSISVNSYLHLWATSGNDGYINIYTSQTNKQICSINAEIAVDYVFISQSPLGSIVFYSEEMLSFFCYSINGLFLCKEEENDGVISPVTINDKSFCDFLVYGTNNGNIVIRAFPNMDFTGLIHVSDFPIKCLDVSEDRTHIYAWTDQGQEIISIKDPRVMSEADKILIWHMGNAFS